jgi:hypothetical protein
MGEMGDRHRSRGDRPRGPVLGVSSGRERPIAVAITGLCYIGIILQIEWAWDAREAAASHAAPNY